MKRLAIAFWQLVCRMKARSYLHVDQDAAREDFPNYSRAVRRHSKLLRLTSREVALIAHVPVLVAQFLIDHPDMIPRPDILKGLAKAFRFPVSYFHKKQSYGERYTCERLLRYSQMGIAVIHNIDAMSHRSRAGLLGHVERLLQRELDASEEDL